MVELRCILTVLLACCLELHSQTDPVLTMTVARDSIGVGEPLVVSLVSDEPLAGGQRWDWPVVAVGDSLPQGWEVIEVSPIDSMASPALEAGLRREQRIVVMAWDTGIKVMEPLALTDSGRMAVRAAAALVEVGLLPLEENAAPKPMQGFKAYEWTLWERIRTALAWGLLAVALALGLRWAYKKWTSREPAETVTSAPEAPEIPAHITALAMLRDLEEKTPWLKGEGKEAQAILSSAVRLHLQGTFGVKALERTTDELARTLSSAPVMGIAAEECRWVIALLERSDLVKFAKQDLDGDAHLRVVRESIAWIERTIPAERPEAASDALGVTTHNEQQDG